MKANYIASKGDLKRASLEAAKEEIKRQMDTFCPKCQANMERQTIAIFCKVLSTQFGFGKKRLKELIEGAEGIGIYLTKQNCDYQICIDWLKEEMGIDLDEK